MFESGEKKEKVVAKEIIWKVKGRLEDEGRKDDKEGKELQSL